MHHIRRLPPTRQLALCRAAISESLIGVQAGAVQALLDVRGVDRPDVVIQHWESLQPAVRQALKRGHRDTLLRECRSQLARGTELQRTQSCVVLVELGGPGSAETLVRSLEDECSDVQQPAAAALLAHFESLAECLETVRTNQSHWLRDDGWESSLWKSYGKALEGYADGRHREGAIVDLLPRLGVPAVPTLVRVLSAHGEHSSLAARTLALLKDSTSATATAMALALAGHTEPVPRALGSAVFEANETSADAARLAAVIASSQAAVLKTSPWPSLLARHADTLPSDVAEAVIPALNHSTDDGGRNACICALLEHAHPTVKLLAAKQIVAWELPERGKLLAPLVASESVELRQLAMREVAKVGFEIYLKRFDGLSPSTREAAARAVAKMDGGIVGRLDEEIRSLDAEARIKALQIVGYIDAGENLRSALLGLLADPDTRVRATALRIVELTGSVPGMKALIDALSDPDRRIRANAIETFESLDEPGYLEIFIPFLSDRDNRVRANAAKALWNLGYPAARDTLAGMLEDEDPLMRQSAIWALSELRCDGAMGLLESREQREPDSSLLSKIGEAKRVLTSAAPEDGPA